MVLQLFWKFSYTMPFKNEADTRTAQVQISHFKENYLNLVGICVKQLGSFYYTFLWYKKYYE